MVSKYKNKKTVVDGITFDSKKEASRYLELKKLKDAGFIDELELQVKFVLIPKQEGERECSYIADFVYKDKQTGETIVEDVKPSPRYKTDVYKIKKKLMLFVYNIKVKEFFKKVENKKTPVRTEEFSNKKRQKILGEKNNKTNKP